tara:strand:- start:104 stop:760 length:657 start_codon:yes stop_codon:yes gene_type:complete
MKKESLKKLKQFYSKDKFSVSAWEQRGLNPSETDIIALMNDGINNCCEKVITSYQNDESNTAYIEILKTGLKNIDKQSLDTEEKEYISDLFFELASILSIDMNNSINSWLYGSLLGGIINISNHLRPKEHIVRTISQNCTRCCENLDTIITKERDDIPDSYFSIIKCKSCSEFNLLDIGPQIESYRFGNYTHEENLPKSEYNLEQAKERLKQIKYWRK